MASKKQRKSEEKHLSWRKLRMRLTPIRKPANAPSNYDNDDDGGDDDDGDDGNDDDVGNDDYDDERMKRNV